MEEQALTSTPYTYGDSDAATRRLYALATVYEASSRSFLEGLTGDEPIVRAADLGCGPGRTTRMVADVFAPSEMIASDRSTRFLELVRRDLPDVHAFAHDVERTPFPWGEADRLYCRFLLGHLRDPIDVLARWVGQLTPGGIVAAEEYESIRSAHPAVADYLEMSELMVASQGATLRLGPALADLESLPAAEILVNRQHTFPVAPAALAEIFALNVPSLRASEHVVERFGVPAIDRLEANLAAFASSDVETTVTVRQVATGKTS